MLYIIIGLLVLVIILLIIVIVSCRKEGINDANITERLGRFELSMMKELPADLKSRSSGYNAA